MPRTGRPPLTNEQIQERIAEYARRYGVTELNPAGFPVFPAGRRETPQHREWIALYQLFNRSRRRAGVPGPDGSEDPSTRPAPCPVCLQPARPPGSTHRRCGGLVNLVRELGPESIERLRAAAFPDDRDAGPAVRSRARRKP